MTQTSKISFTFDYINNYVSFSCWFDLKFPISLWYIFIGLNVCSLSRFCLPAVTRPIFFNSLYVLFLPSTTVLISSSAVLAKTITEIDFLITYLRVPVSYFREISSLAENVIELSFSSAINLATVIARRFFRLTWKLLLFFLFSLFFLHILN